MDKIVSLARNLRKKLTPQKEKLWKLLRNKRYKNLKFRRQYPIGKYIVDFICREKRLIIELDGSQHLNEENIIYDKIRTEYLKQHGYTVLRFYDNDILNNIEAVLNIIVETHNKL